MCAIFRRPVPEETRRRLGLSRDGQVDKGKQGVSARHGPDEGPRARLGGVETVGKGGQVVSAGRDVVGGPTASRGDRRKPTKGNKAGLGGIAGRASPRPSPGQALLCAGGDDCGRARAGGHGGRVGDGGRVGIGGGGSRAGPAPSAWGGWAAAGGGIRMPRTAPRPAVAFPSQPTLGRPAALAWGLCPPDPRDALTRR